MTSHEVWGFVSLTASVMYCICITQLMQDLLSDSSRFKVTRLIPPKIRCLLTHPSIRTAGSLTPAKSSLKATRYPVTILYVKLRFEFWYFTRGKLSNKRKYFLNLSVPLSLKITWEKLREVPTVSRTSSYIKLNCLYLLVYSITLYSLHIWKFNIEPRNLEGVGMHCPHGLRSLCENANSQYSSPSTSCEFIFLLTWTE